MSKKKMCKAFRIDLPEDPELRENFEREVTSHISAGAVVFPSKIRSRDRRIYTDCERLVLAAKLYCPPPVPDLEGLIHAAARREP